jgi:lipopolysaccharide/colanic/teichoic acid biosynthesis glycosyltransferase
MLGLNARALSPSSQCRLFSRFSVYDVVWAAVSPVFAYIMRQGGIDRLDAIATYCAVAFFASLLTFQLFKLSQPMSRFFSTPDAVEVAKASLISVAVAGAFLFTFTRMDETPRSVPLIHFGVLALGLIAGRVIARILHRRRETPKPGDVADSVENIVIIGMSRLAWFYSKLVEEFANGESRIIAILDERSRFQHRSLNGYLIAGSPLHASKIFDEYATHGVEIHKIVIAVPPESLSKAASSELNRISMQRLVPIEILPERPLLTSSPRKVARIHAADFRYDLPSEADRWVWKCKRAVDALLALTALIAASPVAIAVAMLVLIDVGYPVVFWQQRLGRFRRPLRIYKFRTMRAQFDKAGRPVPERERLSPIGRFLRATRLDEIPQLWNILTGEMSVVGPRPLLPVDQPKNFSIRLQVRPGLTGLAQISGGKLISVDEKDALDEYYVRHYSTFTDLGILARTVWVVLRGDKRNETVIAAALAEKKEHGKATHGVLRAAEISSAPGSASGPGRRPERSSLMAGNR